MSPIEWFSLALVCFLGAATPGPSLVVIARVASTNGRTQGMIGAWAHASAIGFYAMLTLVVFASARLMGGPWFWLIGLLGQLWLLYLGFNMLWAWRPGHQHRETLAGPKATSWYHALAIGLFNPKIWIFFTAIFSPFVGQVANPWPLAGLAFAIDGLWYTVVVWFLTRQTVSTFMGRVQKPMDLTMGVLFVALAVGALARSFMQAPWL
ncbi:MAG: LysE family transporter [Natronospirillum sp.]